MALRSDLWTSQMACRLHLIRLFRNTSKLAYWSWIFKTLTIFQFNSNKFTRRFIERQVVWARYKLSNHAAIDSRNVSNHFKRVSVKVINYLAVLTAARETAIVDVYASLWTLSSLLDFEPLTHSFGNSARGCETAAENGQVTADMQSSAVNQQKSTRGTSSTPIWQLQLANSRSNLFAKQNKIKHCESLRVKYSKCFLAFTKTNLTTLKNSRPKLNIEA